MFSETHVTVVLGETRNGSYIYLNIILVASGVVTSDTLGHVPQISGTIFWEWIFCSKKYLISKCSGF